MIHHYLACDLGAESGRVMLGSLENKRLELKEIHRFPNRPIQDGNSLYWDVPTIFNELKTGLGKAADLRVPITSVSCDSWGVDYLLFDAGKRLLSPTFHYRDPRTAEGVSRAYEKTDWPTIYQETGIQFMPLNTLFQLAAESESRLKEAELILGIGDGFNFLLGGDPKLELSMASTFQLYNPTRGGWSQALIQALGFPESIFPEIVPSGTSIGKIGHELAEQTGLGDVEIIASCSHDTGAAVAAVPASGKRWAYISSGTWSLMGVELQKPIITDECREMNFTNEIGYGHSIRLLKNISGLWLVQECRRAWAERGTSYSYAELTQLASESKPFQCLVDPTDDRFVSPDGMPEKIKAFCEDKGQPTPGDVGATIRCALESLALLYKRTLDQLEQLLDWKIEQVHIVGGGSQNELLNQFTSNALGIPVFTGPIEATAAGNVLVQAIAMGHIESLDTARQVVKDSFEIKVYEPEGTEEWTEAKQRLRP